MERALSVKAYFVKLDIYAMLAVKMILVHVVQITRLDPHAILTRPGSRVLKARSVSPFPSKARPDTKRASLKT